MDILESMYYIFSLKKKLLLCRDYQTYVWRKAWAVIISCPVKPKV